MTRDEIIDLACEHTVGGLEFDEEGLLRFVEIIAAAERERILDICKEGLWDSEGIRFHLEKQGSDQ